MYPYFFLILLTLILLVIANRNKSHKIIYVFFVSISATILILFAGLRSNNIGVDTNNYINFFNMFDRDISIFDLNNNRELGFNILQYFAKNISESYWSFLLLIAFVSVSSVYVTFYKLSKNILISVFLYITLATYLFFFNGARQGISASLFGLALINVINRKPKRYFFFLVLAFLFHKTVIIMAPFYYILKLKFTIRRLILFSFFSFIFIYYLSDFLFLFDENFQNKYREYLDRGKSGGQLLGFFYISISLLFIYIRRYISSKNKKIFDVYLNLVIFFSIIYFIVLSLGLDVNLLRLTLFFSFGHLLIWPIIFDDISFFKNYLGKVVFYCPR